MNDAELAQQLQVARAKAEDATFKGGAVHDSKQTQASLQRNDSPLFVTFGESQLDKSKPQIGYNAGFVKHGVSSKGEWTMVSFTEAQIEALAQYAKEQGEKLRKAQPYHRGKDGKDYKSLSSIAIFLNTRKGYKLSLLKEDATPESNIVK